MGTVLLSKLTSQTFVTLLARPAQHWSTLHDLVKDGKVKPVVDKRYGLNQVPEAIRYLERNRLAEKL